MASTYGRPASSAIGGVAGAVRTGSAPSGITTTLAPGISSRTASAVACEEAWTTAPLATARRSTAPARCTSAPTSPGWRRNQQSYTDTTRGRRAGGTT